MLRKTERVQRIIHARRLLKLRSFVTVEHIQDSYRQMAKECHPDTHPEEERTQWEERMREINIAYETLMDYFRRYEFSLSEDVVDRQCRRQDPGEYYSNQWQH